MGVVEERWRRARRVALLALLACLAAPASASAHAFLVGSSPAAGAELARAPRVVTLVFDEGVAPAPGIEVVRDGRGSVLAGKPYVPHGKPTEIVLPLRRNLPHGTYTVRWREIDVDDGHLIVGAFAFAVGTGIAPAQVSLPAGTGGGGPPLSALVGRWLLLAGILAAAGTVFLAALVWRPLLRRLRRPELAAAHAHGDAVVLALALAVAALGGALSVALQPGTSATRFGRWTEIGVAVAAAAAATAAASWRVPALRLPAALAAVALLGLPTATGHAVAPGLTHGLSVPADLGHLAAAALWIGGTLGLVAVAPPVLRTTLGEEWRGAYGALVRRYSPLALCAVALLAATGIGRALEELRGVDQLWTTGYGRALLVKSGLLLALVTLGWLNRHRLSPRLEGAGRAAPLRRSLAVELGLLAVVIGAVAVLTNVRPGRDYPPAAAAAPPATGQTVVFAGEDDDLAVGVAVAPAGPAHVSLRATVLGFQGPVAGLGVRFLVGGRGAAHFVAATPCGAGCYRALAPVGGRPSLVAVRVARKRHRTAVLEFDGPARWPAPSAARLVERAAATIEALHTLVEHSHLASDARHAVDTTYWEVAPDRLRYRNGDGSGSIIVGGRRWDRTPGGPWVERPQNPPIRQPVPFWPPHVVDAHVLRTARVDGRPVWVVSFLDPRTPAWFTAWVDRRSYRTLRLEMIATAHFMHNREGPFDAPIRVEPPR